MEPQVRRNIHTIQHHHGDGRWHWAQDVHRDPAAHEGKNWVWTRGPQGQPVTEQDKELYSLILQGKSRRPLFRGAKAEAAARAESQVLRDPVIGSPAGHSTNLVPPESIQASDHQQGLAADEKNQRLYALAQKRKQTRWPGYGCIGDYHGGVYECDFVSPYTKTAGNVNADVFVLLQDWTSEDSINQGIDPDALQYGRTLWLPTNKLLAELLGQFFNLKMSDCYATNLFPFVKKGGISASIPVRDLIRAGKDFALPQIEIVRPKLVICLGLVTFNALRMACDLQPAGKLEQAISEPFLFENAKIWCQAHTGALGQNNRGRVRVASDWLTMKRDIETA